ncbi:MAG: hypothetical protein IPH38_15050, partial [Candidatus Microthrix sp.]
MSDPGSPIDRCIGITGSVGKTTVKQLTAAGPRRRRIALHATPRSFNTKFSMPGVLASAPSDTECLVLEFGARYRGDSAPDGRGGKAVCGDHHQAW